MRPLSKALLAVLLALAAATHGQEDADKQRRAIEEDGRKKITQAQDLSAQANLRAIQNAIGNYMAIHERFPDGLEDLVSAGLLEALPACSPGRKFVYDPKTGAVTIQSDGTVPPDPIAGIEPTRENALELALDVKAKADLKKIKTALQVFLMQEERYPEKLDELVSKNVLETLPKPPAGSRYDYNPKTGAIRIVKK